jgi:hypothetical protein
MDKINHGLVLKNYKAEWGWWESGESLFEKYFTDEGFFEVDSLANGDCILMNFFAKTANHCGYYSDGKIMHQYQGIISKWENLSKVEKYVTKIVRHKNLL